MKNFLNLMLVFSLLGVSFLSVSCAKEYGPRNPPHKQLKVQRDDKIPKGVYALFNANKEFDKRIEKRVLQSQYIEGVTIRSWWNKLEPEKDVYNWNYLDDQIKIAKRYGLKTKIIILTGATAPKWIYDKSNAKFVSLDIKKKDLEQIRFPVPWDQNYLRRFEKFVQEVFQHFKAESTITGITIGGPGAMSAEMHMPKSWPFCPQGGSSTCMTKKRWISSWKKTIDVFQKYSEDIPFGIGISRPFGEETLVWMDEVLNYAKYKNARFFIQYNGLKEDMSNTTDSYCYDMISQYSKQITTGFQTVWSFTKKPQIGKITNVFNLANNAGVDFVEVYAIDVANPKLKKNWVNGLKINNRDK